LRFTVVTITLAAVFSMPIVTVTQTIQHKGICPCPTHLFMEVLAKVGDAYDLFLLYTSPVPYSPGWPTLARLAKQDALDGWWHLAASFFPVNALDGSLGAGRLAVVHAAPPARSYAAELKRTKRDKRVLQPAH
jgi:hypothetical protein